MREKASKKMAQSLHVPALLHLLGRRSRRSCTTSSTTSTGLINRLLAALGMKPINLYATPRYWYFILPFVYVWKWVGFGSVLYLAAITGHRPANATRPRPSTGRTSSRRYAASPCRCCGRPSSILVLLGVGRIMRGEFDMFYQLIGNNGILIDSTDIIDTLVFRSSGHEPGLRHGVGRRALPVGPLLRHHPDRQPGRHGRFDEDYALF